MTRCLAFIGLILLVLVTGKSAWPKNSVPDQATSVNSPPPQQSVSALNVVPPPPLKLEAVPDQSKIAASQKVSSRVSASAHGIVSGSNNTTVGRIPFSAINGNGNTFVGATDDRGNTIIRGGTAIGQGATADPTSVAIGAGAHAGGQQQEMRCEPGSLCNQGTAVNAPQTVNNYGPPPLKVTVSAPTPVQWAPPPGKYAAEITVSTNIDWSPVSLLIDCNSPVESVGLPGSHVQVHQVPSTPYMVEWQSPPISPKSPQAIVLISTAPITTCQVVTR